MQSNVLAYFEQGSARASPDKVAIVDGETRVTFSELQSRAKRFAAILVARADILNQPVAVYLPKSADTVIADLGILYSGNVYCNLDIKSPPQRLKNILGHIGPVLVVTTRPHADAVLAAGIGQDGIVLIDDADADAVDAHVLQHRLARLIDTDPLCIINTSGSTGTPKGVVLSHRGTIDFMDWVFDTFPSLDDATVIGHSLGGAIALHVALARPDLVNRLGLVAPAGLGKAPPWWWYLLTGYEQVYRRALAIPSPFKPLLIRQGLKRFLDWRLFHDPGHLEDDIRHLVDMHSTPADLGRLLKAGRCCIDSYTGRLLGDSTSLDIPMWMVWGRHDGLVPSEHALAFGQAHPDAAGHVFEDCGHYILEDARDEVIPLVESFLQRHPLPVGQGVG